MQALGILYGLAIIIAWLSHVTILVSQAYHEALTLGKLVIHAVGIFIPVLSPITVWFV